MVLPCALRWHDETLEHDKCPLTWQQNMSFAFLHESFLGTVALAAFDENDIFERHSPRQQVKYSSTARSSLSKEGSLVISFLKTMDVRHSTEMYGVAPASGRVLAKAQTAYLALLPCSVMARDVNEVF